MKGNQELQDNPRDMACTSSGYAAVNPKQDLTVLALPRAECRPGAQARESPSSALPSATLTPSFPPQGGPFLDRHANRPNGTKLRQHKQKRRDWCGKKEAASETNVGVQRVKQTAPTYYKGQQKGEGLGLCCIYYGRTYLPRLLHCFTYSQMGVPQPTLACI